MRPAMDDAALHTAMQAQRTISGELTEILDLTEQLKDAFSRQDQVSVELFLDLRQKAIDRVQTCREELTQLLRSLPQPQQTVLRQLLSGAAPQTTETEPLARLVHQNHRLLERVQQADRTLSLRAGGPQSFYR